MIVSIGGMIRRVRLHESGKLKIYSPVNTRLRDKTKKKKAGPESEREKHTPVIQL